MSTNKALLNGGMDVKRENGGPNHFSAHGTTVHEKNDDKGCCGCTCLQKISNSIVGGLEKSFYRLGKLVARNPWKTIFACMLVCGIAGVGLMRWHEETEYVKVWLPRGSRMYEEDLWVKENFPERIRYEAVIVEDENVLSPQTLNAMYDIFKTAQNFKSDDDATLDNLCIKAGPICRVNSILELWGYNESVIRSLTEESIYGTVNQDVIQSPLYRNVMDLDKILGGVQRDNESRITGARATTFFWFLKRNESSRAAAESWEKQLINLINDVGHKHIDKLYIYTARTFDDVISGAASHDVGLLTIGFAFVYLFLTFSIGNYSLLEHKIFLAMSGLLSIGMAIIFTYGVGLGTGIMFGPIHQITPFMLLGIGVDDMFVIVESLRQLTPKERQLPVQERIGLTLKHAGVSITVTSVTDIVAFGIGGSTVIPSLSTFCLYAAIGVLALYILQATFFVACVTLDEKRIDSKRNACIMCYKHDDNYKPGKYYSFSLQYAFMRNIWGPLLTKIPVKVIVILAAFAMTGVNIWSFIRIKHDFDPSMYLPKDSYSQKYVEADRNYFPNDGAFVQMYCGKLDYNQNFDRLFELYHLIKDKPSVQSTTVDFWLASFVKWQNETSNVAISHAMTNLSQDISVVPYQQDWLSQLMQFLMTKDGRVYLRNIKFDNVTSPTKITGSVLTFRHVKCTTSICNIKAMDDMRDLVDGYSLPGGGTCFVYSNPQYMFNETNKVLKLELYRNLALAAVCVFVVTLILIANFWTSLLVFFCVVCTVIDVAGTMQFWDISVDTASSVLLILCFGLAVDYSAHIGHSFMTHTGNKNERTRKTLVSMGPAVFSGGFSTFLAFLLLVNSISYGFTLFFRIFTSVVIFGLFHGLVFLPVILSLIGPEPYNTNFLSETDKLEAKYLEAADIAINVHNSDMGDIQMTELHPLKKTANGSIKDDSLFWKEFDSALPGNNYDQCNSLPNSQGVLDIAVNNEHNPRYSGSYYEQMSNGSLVQIPFPEPHVPYTKTDNV
ncbi:patched domain-containing protein 3-like isoform X1 [Mercenaria mercenaria]|uniref:patched domain-containing protein 3-like isoform X1 n=1 Tax=Mercenaria mercenaria TaxID=6596 RepID=UPI00234F2D26|nr:patched domain-containing protein 3-like isoform X1 [Mercenaria mercenaria]XP_045159870.2 patched domain-containing protein 3-like isoform X1 [Mercenaria mercenaria]XP_045159871.2 patched domain-containing protein 3-like isoform X1 [Mercenaria mercenaria]